MRVRASADVGALECMLVKRVGGVWYCVEQDTRWKMRRERAYERSKTKFSKASEDVQCDVVG